MFCERTGNWAAAWRRNQSRRERSRGAPFPSPARLIETRSAAECREVAAANRGCFVVVELEPSRAEQALDLLFELGASPGARFALAASAVVASRQMLGHEWLARELGALAFIASPLDLDSLCDLAQRHVGRTSVDARDVRQQIWENLPWGPT